MNLDDLFDEMFDAVVRQSIHYERTGEVAPLQLHDELTLDDNDPPDVRRRVIIFRAKLKEWAAMGELHERQRMKARFLCVENLQAILEEL